MSSPAHRINSRTKFSSSQTEVLHLKQRLSESRQSTVRLEMKVAQLRTDNAKLLGSQQALNTIREQLSQENCRLSAREREMDDEWQRERERLTDQVNSMTAEADQLREQLHVQRQQLMARVGELEEENQTLSLTELASESQSRLEHVEVELGQLTRVLQDQERWIGRETEVCGGEMTALRTELTKIEESSKLTAAMNEATNSQLQVCESSICELIGEVEILRARRTVIMKHGGVTQTDTATVTLHNRKLEGEVNELRAALQQCSCGALSRDQSCDQLERGLKDRLRSQTRQTNYCRVKLGYALSELRLYKELKVAMESHVAELQSTIESLKCQYQQCLERLHQAEALGFTTNTSLFTTAVS